ncbi:MAG: hypothetical protein M1436_10670, partial [Acidobacteria bacterium]|nr:hypothetical protein [Acidobacteriota bacterium]
LPADPSAPSRESAGPDPVSQSCKAVGGIASAEVSGRRDPARSYGGVGRGSVPMHHGDGGKQEAIQADAERFFRAVDQAVLEHHSQPSGLPLILAALPEHHHLFRRVSHNPFLIAEGLTINPVTPSIDELRKRAWQVVEPQYQAMLVTLADEFLGAKSKGVVLCHEPLVQETRITVLPTNILL